MWLQADSSLIFEAKNMIVSQFIRSARVSRDYNIEVNFNVSFDEL